MRIINCCAIVKQNHTGMPEDFHNKMLKCKWDDTHARVRGILTAMIWKDK